MRHQSLKYFNSDIIILVGDRVEIARFLRKAYKGIVVRVYNPEEPSPPNGLNDYGFSVTCPSVKINYWVSGNSKKIRFVERGQPVSPIPNRHLWTNRIA
jgi:hypothetical protein